MGECKIFSTEISCRGKIRYGLPPILLKFFKNNNICIIFRLLILFFQTEFYFYQQANQTSNRNYYKTVWRNWCFYFSKKCCLNVSPIVWLYRVCKYRLFQSQGFFHREIVLVFHKKIYCILFTLLTINVQIAEKTINYFK